MSRFGELTVSFHAPGDLSTVLGTRTAVSARFKEIINGAGESEIVFVNDSDLNSWAVVGNIVWAYKTDSVRTDTSEGIVFAEPFTIARRSTEMGSDYLTISGPNLLSELKRFTIYRPLGAAVVSNTTLDNDQVTASEYPITTRTLAAGAPANNESIIPSVSTSRDVNQEIRITLDNNVVFVTVITARVNVNNTWRYQLRDRLPSAAANGNAIAIRRRTLKVASIAGFVVGGEVEVTLQSGTFTSLVEEINDNIITLRDGLPGTVGQNAAVKHTTYSDKSTNDVTQVLSFATGWSASFESGTGSEVGTRYGGGGETIYSILQSIADETGELFRLRSAETAPRGPKRTVRWNRTRPAAGVGGTLRLVEPSQANMASNTANINRAILIRRPEHSGEYDPVTQLIPVAGDAKVTLFSCSPAAVSAAAADGFTVVTSGLGLYAPAYINWGAQTTARGVYQRRVTFSEVTVESDSAPAITEAADKLLNLSIQYMKAHLATNRRITVECVSPVGIRPGDTVELYYVPPTGEYTLNYTSGSSEPHLYVIEVERRVSNTGEYPGVPITRLLLSPTIDTPGTAANEIGRRLMTIDRLASRGGTPNSINLSVSSTGTIDGVSQAVFNAHINNTTTAHGATTNTRANPNQIMRADPDGKHIAATLEATTLRADVITGTGKGIDIRTVNNAVRIDSQKVDLTGFVNVARTIKTLEQLIAVQGMTLGIANTDGDNDEFMAVRPEYINDRLYLVGKRLVGNLSDSKSIQSQIADLLAAFSQAELTENNAYSNARVIDPELVMNIDDYPAARTNYLNVLAGDDYL